VRFFENEESERKRGLKKAKAIMHSPKLSISACFFETIDNLLF
jgi:hypothetical protein